MRNLEDSRQSPEQRAFLGCQGKERQRRKSLTFKLRGNIPLKMSLLSFSFSFQTLNRIAHNAVQPLLDGSRNAHVITRDTS